MRRADRSGFTLVEAVVATALAAMGFAVVFQGLGAAALLAGASRASEKAVLVAQSVLAEGVLGSEEAHTSGITGGIAWTLDTSTLMRREDGATLVHYEVLAEGARGRRVHLVTERAKAGTRGGS